MVYLFIGSLLIIAAKSQNCTTSDDCSSSMEPICADYGECVECMTNAHCVNNSNFAFQGKDTCEDYLCEQGPCSSDDDCTFYPEIYCDTTSTCVECTLTSQCTGNRLRWGEGYSCQNGFCVNYTSPATTSPPFCTTSEDCEDLEQIAAGIENGCQTITYGDASFSLCLPQGNCEQTSDCLAGLECQVTDILPDVYSFGFCIPSNNTCTQNSDCEAIDSSLACYEPDGVCYLPCDSNEDCDLDGWACAYIQGIWGCSLEATANVTMTDMPTTSEGNADGATSLTIFGGMIIMIKSILFM